MSDLCNEWMTVDLPYACFHIEVKDNVVVKAAPIGAWMVGKTVEEIARWVATKKGTIS